MFENPRRGRQARSFTTNVPKILDLKSSSEQTFFRKLSLGALHSGTENGRLMEVQILGILLVVKTGLKAYTSMQRAS